MGKVAVMGTAADRATGRVAASAIRMAAGKVVL